MARKNMLLGEQEAGVALELLGTSDAVGLKGAVMQAWNQAHDTPLSEAQANQGAEEVYKIGREAMKSGSYDKATAGIQQDAASNLWTNLEFYRRQNHKRASRTVKPSWMQQEKQAEAPESSSANTQGTSTRPANTREVKSGFENMTQKQIEEMPATGSNASGESDYAKKIKSENETFTKANDEYEKKRKDLFAQDGNYRDDLKKLEDEHKIAERTHGVNRIQNAMDAMQNTETFKAAFTAEHAKHPNLAKANYMQTVLDNRGGFLGDQKKLISSMQDELGLDKAGRAEMNAAISQIGDAGRIAAENQRIARTRYGKFIQAVHGEGGLRSMSNDDKIKLLGMNQKAQDKLLVSNSWLPKEAIERKNAKVLDKLIMKKSEIGEREIGQAADFSKKVRAGNAEAIYDATHREGKSTYAASRIANSRQSASKAGEGIMDKLSKMSWGKKAGAAGALLGLGAILGTMMGHHGEQSNAQLYNPNPQPQYSN